jgi:hypothetical protein
MTAWRETKPALVPPIPEAVKIAAIDAMGAEASSVGSHLKGAHRHNAKVRAVLRKAAHYAAKAEVNEAALVAYLKGRL